MVVSLFFVFLLALQILFPIYRTARQIKKDLAMTLGSSIVVESLINTDMTDLYDFIEMENGAVVTIYKGDEFYSQDKIDQIASLEGVVSYNARTDEVVYFPELNYDPGLEKYYYEADEEYMRDESNYWMTVIWEQSSIVYGCCDSSKDDYFLRGALKLIEGRHVRPDDQGVVLISRWMKEHNGLEIGDHITGKVMQDSAYGTGTTDDILNKYDLKIIGVFDIISTQFHPFGDDYILELDNKNNSMFSDYNTVYEMNEDVSAFIKGYRNTEKNYHEVSFFLDDPAKADRVMAQIKDLDFFNPTYYSVHYGNSAFTASIAPLSKMQKITGAFLVLTVTGIAVMMIAAERLITQKNRREIGILLSVGKKRGAILRSFLTETLILLLIAEAVAAPVGLLTASRIGETMYRKGDNSYVIETEYGEQRVLPIQPGQWDSFVDVPSYAPEEIDVSVSVWDCVYAFLLCGGIVLVIQMISLLLILKERPRKLILQR